MSNVRALFQDAEDLFRESDSQLALPGVIPPDSEWTWSEEEEDKLVDRFSHTTVMREEVIRALDVHDGLYVDVTLGGGGHTEAILEASPDARVIAIDRDPAAISAAKERLSPFLDRVTFMHSSFSNVLSVLKDAGIETVDGLCADLGVSSPQLDEAERGMSFRREGPIDMRMDPTQGETALEVIGSRSDEELADIIFKYGDERRSRRIARSIKRAFDEGELKSTLDLRRAIVRATGPVRTGGVDPATRTFQALRIAVNDEQGELRSLLEALPNVLSANGVAAIISFHSLEDRLVKHAFHVRETWQPLTKKPMMASDDEKVANARSRSAKLRAARLLENDCESDR